MQWDRWLGGLPAYRWRAGKLEAKRQGLIGGRPELNFSFVCIAPEINPFDVKRSVTGIYRKYDSESILSDSKITFPFSLQLLDINVYRLAAESSQKTLNLLFHFTLNAFRLNKTVGIPRVFDTPFYISKLSVRVVFFRLRGFP